MIAIDQEFVFLAILAAFVFIRAYRVLKVYSMTEIIQTWAVGQKLWIVNDKSQMLYKKVYEYY